MAIQRIVTTLGPLALVPFRDLVSFSRTYENIVEYARKNKCKEFTCKNDNERISILRVLHSQIPSLQYIALGECLPMQWGDSAGSFLIAKFQNGTLTELETNLVDVTLCEDEYIKAVCVFKT
jgi:hypothetical protein